MQEYHDHKIQFLGRRMKRNWEELHFFISIRYDWRKSRVFVYSIQALIFMHCRIYEIEYLNGEESSHSIRLKFSIFYKQDIHSLCVCVSECYQLNPRAMFERYCERKRRKNPKFTQVISWLIFLPFNLNYFIAVFIVAAAIESVQEYTAKIDKTMAIRMIRKNWARKHTNILLIIRNPCKRYHLFPIITITTLSLRSHSWRIVPTTQFSKKKKTTCMLYSVRRVEQSALHIDIYSGWMNEWMNTIERTFEVHY